MTKRKNKNMATMYDKGSGTDQDYVLARNWYEKALDIGEENMRLENNLGVLYARGLGMTVDYPKAQMYFERAIKKVAEQHSTIWRR